jgi:hypothetical protein
LQGNAAMRTSQWRGKSNTTRRGLHKTAPRALWFQVQHLGALYHIWSLRAACRQPRWSDCPYPWISEVSVCLGPTNINNFK